MTIRNEAFERRRARVNPFTWRRRMRHAWEEYILPVLLIVGILAIGIPAIGLILALGAVATVCGWAMALCFAVMSKHGGAVALAAAIAFAAWMLADKL